jgi:hypothetical protein
MVPNMIDQSVPGARGLWVGAGFRPERLMVVDAATAALLSLPPGEEATYKVRYQAPDPGTLMDPIEGTGVIIVSLE